MIDKPKLLCIDDEERILSSLKLIFRKTHDVYITTSPEEFEQILTNNHIHVVISDQRMPAITGTELLKGVLELSPNTMRILLTGYADVSAVVDSMNESEIFRYITKPWDNDELKTVVLQATNIARQIEHEPIPQTTKHLEKEVVSKIKLNKPSVLFIFDNKKISDEFERVFSEQYSVTCANTMAELEEKLTKKQFQVAITDVEFGGQSLAPLIYLLKNHQPDLVTIAMTASLDISVLVDLINKGQVFRCLPKPVRKKMLQRSLEHAVVKHQQLKNDSLQQLRHQVEEAPETQSLPEGLKGLSGLFGRFKKIFKPKTKAT